MKQGEIFLKRHGELLKRYENLPRKLRIIADETLELADLVAEEHHYLFDVYGELIANWKNRVETDNWVDDDGEYDEAYKERITDYYDMYLDDREIIDWFMVENITWLEEFFLLGFANSPRYAMSCRIGDATPQIEALYKKSLPGLDKLVGLAHELAESVYPRNDPNALTLAGKIMVLQEAEAA